MTKKILKESNDSVNLRKDDKSLFVEGIFLSSEVENGNKRRYPKAVLTREMKKFQKLIDEKRALGEIDHPDKRSETDLSKSALLVESLQWKGNDIWGKAKVLSTPAGQIAKALINDGVKFGISSRGLGSVIDGIVQEDYQLMSFDLVANPSNPGSGDLNAIYESIKKVEEEQKPTPDKLLQQIWKMIDEL